MSKSLFADPDKLAKMLKYHIVPKYYIADELLGGEQHQPLMHDIEGLAPERKRVQDVGLLEEVIGRALHPGKGQFLQVDADDLGMGEGRTQRRGYIR